MDHKNHTITLYSAQTHNIAQRLRDGQTHRVKIQFIREKYGSVAHIFTNAYHWYTGHAAHIVRKPDEAESAVWAFADPRSLERHLDSTILQLNVPLDQPVCFRMSDWNKILNLRYIGQSDTEEAAYANKLAQQGIGYEGDVYQKPFYPLLKRELIASWQNLFRHHRAICEAWQNGDTPDIADIQVGLWEIRPEWVAGSVD